MSAYSQNTMSYNNRANRAYTESAVLSASPSQLVIMLYDGAIRFLSQASAAMDAGNRDVARNRIFRADDIINELNNTLDMEQGGQISEQLRSIYLWTKRQMMEAVTEQDSAKVQECIQSLAELREAWAQTAQTV